MPENNESNETLRQKLEAAIAENKTLAATVTTLTGANVLHEANLSHLSETQRKAVLTMHEGDVTPESILTTAKALGYEPKTATPPAPTPNPAPPTNADPENQPDPQQTSGNVQATLSATLAEMAQDPNLDPAAALEALTRIQTAAAGSNLKPGESFADRIKDTKSPQELEHLISTQGAANGLLLGSDLD